MTDQSPHPALSLGIEEFRWPAEWEPHEATWVAWPHNKQTWPRNLSAAQDEMENLIRTLSRYEPVRVLAGEESMAEIEARGFGKLDEIELMPIATDDAWIRDYGPLVLRHRENNRAQFLNYNYNAWGGKYSPYDQDQQVTFLLALHGRTEFTSIPAILEGGAIDGNGAGALLTTESCLLHPSRNPSLNRIEIESLLRASLMVDQIIWLPGGELVGDDTEGHVDQIARFVSQDRIVVATESDKTDPNNATLDRNLEFLETTLTGMELISLPLPEPVEMYGVRLPASYANFIWANGAMIVPQFDVGRDEEAVRILSELVPDREVIGMPCRNLLVGLGAWHCLTQQLPA